MMTFVMYCKVMEQHPHKCMSIFLPFAALSAILSALAALFWPRFEQAGAGAGEQAGDGAGEQAWTDDDPLPASDGEVHMICTYG